MECLRVAGSIIAWRRIATSDTVVGGVHIAEGSKLLIVQISANADADHFENPEVVDLYRENAVEHMTFGYGAHHCLGRILAEMEIEALYREIAKRVKSVELAGTPEWVKTNHTGGLKHLPVRVEMEI